MITDDCKSGVSVPENFKPTRIKTPSTPSPQAIDLGSREVALAKPSKPRSSFETLAARFARHDMILHRTDWRDGPVTYFAIKNQQVRHLPNLSDLALILWVWEKNHG